jgi:DNA (cytosine-5)-methyltransferase 1
MKTKNINIASFFTGAGGIDIGFEGNFIVPSKSIDFDEYPEYQHQQTYQYVKLKKTRFTNVYCNDINPKAERVYNGNLKHKNYEVGSIVDVVDKWQNNPELIPQNIDVVTGGFPCKDFSLCGRRGGFNSHKNHDGVITDKPTPNNRGRLYYYMSKAIELIRPKIFIAENVSALQSMTNVFDTIKKDFANIGDGYHILHRDCNFADYGVPQNRKRIIFIGVLKTHLKKPIDKIDFWPTATHKNKHVSTMDYLFDLVEPENAICIDQKKYSRAKKLKSGQGQKEINPKKPAMTIRAEHHGNIEFRRLKNGLHVEELQRGLQQRRLTIHECARLQTFPIDYNFCDFVSATDAYKLIGNAVSPLFAFYLANKLQNIWSDIF